MGISVLAIVLMQSDKIILSKLVTLTDFGYYTLAATVSSSLAMVLYPISGAVFPRITELLNKENKTKFLELFHASSQLVSLIIIPLGISLFIFSHDIILAWTRDAEIARRAGPIMKYLVLGTTINSLMTIPYQYTLSIGWLRFGINISIVGIIFFLPAIFFAVDKYGALGGAFIWMILNSAYLIFAMYYLFSRHLQTEKIKWYLRDVIRPLVICLFFATPFFLINEYRHLTNFKSLLLFGSCLSVCYLVTLLIGVPELKPEVKHFISRVRGSKTVSL
jgi:O-antigen/teichoic acid export membrane protein